MSGRPIDLQLSSKLFCLPLELRQYIYDYSFPDGIHACLSQDRIILSACLQSSPSAIYGGGRERNPSNNLEMSKSAHYLYARRLRSKWGPHWRCEELAMDLGLPGGFAKHSHLNVMRVCRRMRTDMLNFVLNTSKLNVTDLDTLQRILSLTKASPVALTIVPGTLSRSLVYIRNLAITIRLPLRTFRLISRYVKGINTSLINYKHAAWLRVIKALTKLTQLQTLSLWVDHDSGSPWSRVNERTFFSPLQELMQKRPKLKISVDVPTIDPRRIDDERHYTTNGPRPPFILNRTRRHGYWVGMSTEGFCHTGQDKHTEDSVSDCPTCDERTIDSPDERASADDTLAHVDDSKRSIDKVKLEEIESRIEKLCLREIKANAVIQEGRRTLREARYTRRYETYSSMDPSDTDDDMDTRNRREWKQEQREHRRKCAVKHKWSKSLYEVNEGDSTSPVCLIPSSFPQVRNDLHANKDLAIKADRTLMWPNPFSHL